MPRLATFGRQHHAIHTLIYVSFLLACNHAERFMLCLMVVRHTEHWSSANARGGARFHDVALRQVASWSGVNQMLGNDES